MLQARVARHRANVLAMCAGMDKINDLRREICRMQDAVDAARASSDLLDHRDARALEELLAGNPVVAPEGWMSELDNVVHFPVEAHVTTVSGNGAPREITSVSVDGVRGPIHSVLTTRDLDQHPSNRDRALFNRDPSDQYLRDAPLYERCRCPAVLIVKN